MKRGDVYVAELRPRSGVDDLTAADAFEATFSTTASATAEHVEAIAKTGENIRLGMVAVRILDGVVKNKYANDVGKLAAWLSASHVEKCTEEEGTDTVSLGLRLQP